MITWERIKEKEEKKKEKKKRGKIMGKLWNLFRSFALIGVSTFGGGYAMLPILQREVVEKKGWATEEELTDYYAIGQCTPGIIAVNTATFIGYRLAGVMGGIAATLGLVFPSVIIITIIAMFLQNFAELAIVTYAFNGIRACVCALILSAVIKLGKKSIVDYRCGVIFLLVLGASMLTPVSPVVLIVCAGLAGILLKPESKQKKND